MDAKSGSRAETAGSGSDRTWRDAELTAFGFEPSRVRVEVLGRPRSWRVTRALLTLGIGLGLTPVVALIPPHLPWAVLALAVTVLLARRRMSEQWTLCSMAGGCPRCGQPAGTERRRITKRMILACTGCSQQLELRVDLPAPGAGERSVRPRAG